MSSPPPEIAPPAGRAAAVVLAACFALICVEPYLGRLKSPSLYSDDVVRVAQLQTSPLRVLLFRPINEHMAPVFATISWATWVAAGGRLTGAVRAFTLVSYLPFVLSLGVLGLVVRGSSARRRRPWWRWPPSASRGSTSRRSCGIRPAASPGRCWGR
jgi:hypothetical protein